MYWITAFLGVVLISAPFVLGFSDNQSALWTSELIGFTLVGASLLEWAAEGVQRWEYWVLAIAGAAALISPVFIGFELMSTSSLTMILSGVVAISISGYKLFLGKKSNY